MIFAVCYRHDIIIGDSCRPIFSFTTPRLSFRKLLAPGTLGKRPPLAAVDFIRCECITSTTLYLTWSFAHVLLLTAIIWVFYIKWFIEARRLDGWIGEFWCLSTRCLILSFDFSHNGDFDMDSSTSSRLALIFRRAIWFAHVVQLRAVMWATRRFLVRYAPGCWYIWKILYRGYSFVLSR